MGDFGPAEKVKADDIAAVFRSEIRADVEALKAQGVHPTLVGFLGTGDVSAKKYSEWTMKACEADGIKFEVREVSHRAVICTFWPIGAKTSDVRRIFSWHSMHIDAGG